MLSTGMNDMSMIEKSVKLIKKKNIPFFPEWTVSAESLQSGRMPGHFPGMKGFRGNSSLREQSGEKNELENLPGTFPQ